MASSVTDRLSPNISSTSVLIQAIRVAETAERYDDMVRLVKLLVVQKSAKSEPLSLGERNLFSVAYKNTVGAKRASWRTLNGGFDDADSDLIGKYQRGIVEKELSTLCQEAIDLVLNHLYPVVKDQKSETEVFYLKMLGDYYRYLAEINPTDDIKDRAVTFYQQSMAVAETTLRVTHPTRLGLVLNFSVMRFELLDDPQTALTVAQKAFDAAIEDLDNLDQSNYKDSTMIMQLLRDNVTLWTSEVEERNNPEFKRFEDEYNDGIDITKWAKRVKAARHDPNSEQDMHDMKADMQRLGLMPQNTEEPESEKDKIREGLVAVFQEITNEEMYKEVIHLILDYEAWIDLSRSQCESCGNYFGCDVFENLCSECFEEEQGVEERKRRCKEGMESIAVRLEWISSPYRYYSMRSMPSLCSMKIMFRILNRNKFRCESLESRDENDRRLFRMEMCDRIMKDDEEPSDDIKEILKRNERCITDFGITAMSVCFLS